MANARKSLADHELENTRARYSLPDSDVNPGRPKIPRGISGEAKAAFKRLTKMLQQRRTLTSGDQEILRLYAHAYDRHQRALAKLAEEGEIRCYEQTTKGGDVISVERENLWLPICQNAERYMRGLLSDLGLNPIQRTRVKKTEVPQSSDAIPTVAETTLPSEEISLEDINESQLMEEHDDGPGEAARSV